MPSGDAQRTWFPEMIKILHQEWNASMSWKELVTLRDRLDTALQTIRSQRNILPSILRCPRCKAVGRSAPPKVLVRAMILALERFGIAPEAEVKALEKSWKKYRKENGLGLCGQTVQAQEGHVVDFINHSRACGAGVER
jgi:hypothetical protein